MALIQEIGHQRADVVQPRRAGQMINRSDLYVGELRPRLHRCRSVSEYLRMGGCHLDEHTFA
jgi:hypothetical protein